MKIPVKVTKMVEIPNSITINHEHFQDLIDYMKTLRFVETSCKHNTFESFISIGQGGNNLVDLSDITLFIYHNRKYTFIIAWGMSSPEVIILESH